MLTGVKNWRRKGGRGTKYEEKLMTSYMDGPKFHISTVSITCTSPNLVLILDTFTFASPDSENTLTLFVSGFFEIVTNSPPRVSS